MLGLNILDYVVMLLVPLTFFSTSKEDMRRWWEIPEVKIAVYLLLAASASCIFYWLQSVITTFQEFGKTILVYGLVVLFGVKGKGYKAILWTMLLSVGLMAIHGILQTTNGAGFGGLKPLFRQYDGVYQIIAFGIFNDPNDLCLIFILALPILYSEFKATINPIVKTASLFLMFIYLAGARLTNSRGGVVGMFGMIAVYFILRTKGWKRMLMILASVLIIFVLAPARFAYKLQVDTDRASAWGVAIDAFKQQPILGIGYGNFADYNHGLVAHNSFIETLAELGIIGYTAWFLLIYFTILHMYRLISMGAMFKKSDMLSLSGLTAALAGYLTASYFLSREYNIVLYVLLALATAKAIMIAREYEYVYEQVFVNWKKDIKRGLILMFASIPFFWITIRMANALAGR